MPVPIMLSAKQCEYGKIYLAPDVSSVLIDR